MGIKVLVATKETQGRRGNDFCHAKEGDLVRYGSECDGEGVDGKCGCRRALVGLHGGATTTMLVVERDMTLDQFRGEIRAGLTRDGWLSFGTDEDHAKFVADETADILKIADLFKVGSIVEKRGDTFRHRPINGDAKPKPKRKPRAKRKPKAKKIITCNKAYKCSSPIAIVAGRSYGLIKTYWYNGEGWVKVVDDEGTVIDAPDVFFDNVY